MMRGMSWRHAIAVAAATAIIVAGAVMPVRVNITGGYVAQARDDKPDMADAQLRGLRAWNKHFTGQRRIGLIIDEQADALQANRIHHLLQYAAAPVLVDDGQTHDVTVAWFADPAQLDRFCTEAGFQIVAKGRPGAAVLKRSETP